jgi:hypothetical protein
MAKVDKVDLDIQYPMADPHPEQLTAHVTVRSSLSFAPEEAGKDFIFEIALYGSDVGEPGWEAAHQLVEPKALYKFFPPPERYTVIQGQVGGGAVIKEEVRDIPMAVLNEDPEPSQTSRPLNDEIYAIVRLSTLSKGRSNIVTMKYYGKKRRLP